MMSSLFSATLTCLHIVEFSSRHLLPVLDESVWCQKCRLYRKVAVCPARYSIKCLDCRFSRATYGHVRLSAERDAYNHRTRYSEHSVQLWNGQRLDWTFTPENSGQSRLPIDTGAYDPPY